jgi:Rrf2 family protein
VPILSRRSLNALAAVLDVAVNARGQPVAAKAIAQRLDLPPRHLEPLLQDLVRAGLLKGWRGPRGGYELARERRRISVADVLRAAGTIEDEQAASVPLIADVVLPALAPATRGYLATLEDITFDDLVRRAEALPASTDRPQDVDFTI